MINVRFICMVTLIFFVSLTFNVMQVFLYPFPSLEARVRKYFSIFVVTVFTPLGAELSVSGQELLEKNKDKSLLILANHVSYADWIVFYMIAARLDCTEMVKIVTKSLVKWIPGLGWATILGRFPVVSKAWNKDASTLRELAKYYRKEQADGRPSWIFIFPEGTFVDDYKDPRVGESKQFCRDRNLPSYNHVLCPRVKGVQLFLNEMPDLQVIDITMSYSNPYTTDLALHDSKRKVPSINHFFEEPFIKSIEVVINEVDTAAPTWLYDLFKKKDEILKNPPETKPWYLSNGSDHQKIMWIWTLLTTFVISMIPVWMANTFFMLTIAGFCINSFNAT